MAIEALLQDEQEDQPQETTQQQQDTPAAPTEPVDADAQALADAEAELAAEEEAAKAGEGDKPAPDPAAEPGADATPAAPAADKTQVMVPKERLDQESAKRRKAEDEALLERGRREALETIHKAGGPQAGTRPAVEAVKTPAEQIKDLRSKQLADAKLYNDGEIDPVEWTKRNAEVDDAIADIRIAGAAHVATERATAPQNSEWLASETAKLEQAFPVLAQVSHDELTPLAEIAKAEMRREGKAFDSRSRESVLELRQRTAELADHNFGHRLPAGAAPATPAKSATNATPASPAANAAQRAAKARLAEGLPPDITRAGSAASATGLSAARVEKMDAKEMDGLTDAELEALDRGLF